MIFDHCFDYLQAQASNERFWKYKSNYEKRFKKDKDEFMKMISEMVDTPNVHWFKNLSVGQAIEKFDCMTNRALRFEKNKAKSPNITGINLHIIIHFFENNDFFNNYYWKKTMPKRIREDVEKPRVKSIDQSASLHAFSRFYNSGKKTDEKYEIKIAGYQYTDHLPKLTYLDQYEYHLRLANY